MILTVRHGTLDPENNVDKYTRRPRKRRKLRVQWVERVCNDILRKADVDRELLKFIKLKLIT